MSESDAASVECPLCGEAFDPTAAGGWCTNSDCGEWQYETDVTPDQQGEPGDGPADGDDAGASERGDETSGGTPTDASGDGAGIADAAAEGQTGSDEGAASDGSAAADTAADADEAAATDDSPPDESPKSEPPAGESGTDASAAYESTADSPVASGSADETESFDCPGCGSTLDAAVNFCPDCGEDVSALPADEERQGAELDACPSCGADVGPADNFCVACGEDLSTHRGADVLATCPDCGTDVDADDSFCAGCGADLDAHRAGDSPAAAGGATGDEQSGAEPTAEAPESLALVAHGQSVVVEDGDAVGREIRGLLTDAGRPEDEAVRVHREHVRFVRESGQFYLVDLGANPTRLNGHALSKGDREPVAPGDELELSDVVTLAVEAT